MSALKRTIENRVELIVDDTDTRMSDGATSFSSDGDPVDTNMLVSATEQPTSTGGNTGLAEWATTLNAPTFAGANEDENTRMESPAVNPAVRPAINGRLQCPETEPFSGATNWYSAADPGVIIQGTVGELQEYKDEIQKLSRYLTHTTKCVEKLQALLPTGKDRSSRQAEEHIKALAQVIQLRQQLKMEQEKNERIQKVVKEVSDRMLADGNDEAQQRLALHSQLRAVKKELEQTLAREKWRVANILRKVRALQEEARRNRSLLAEEETKSANLLWKVRALEGESRRGRSLLAEEEAETAGPSKQVHQPQAALKRGEALPAARERTNSRLANPASAVVADTDEEEEIAQPVARVKKKRRRHVSPANAAATHQEAFSPEIEAERIAQLCEQLSEGGEEDKARKLEAEVRLLQEQVAALQVERTAQSDEVLKCGASLEEQRAIRSSIVGAAYVQVVTLRNWLASRVQRDEERLYSDGTRKGKAKVSL